MDRQTDVWTYGNSPLCCKGHLSFEAAAQKMRDLHTNLPLKVSKQGQIHGRTVADGWAEAVMQKPLAIQKCYGPTDRQTRQGVESRVHD